MEESLRSEKLTNIVQTLRLYTKELLKAIEEQDAEAEDYWRQAIVIQTFNLASELDHLDSKFTELLN